MALTLPHPNIQQIVNNSPATPDLWNTRYDEIDENFAAVKDLLDTCSVSSSTSTPGIVALATDSEVQGGTVTNKAVTPKGLSSRIATESRTGLVELATAAEVQAGTDNTRAVTPKKATDLINLLMAKFGLGGGVGVTGTATVSGSYATNDLNDINRTGIYTVSGSKNAPASTSLIFHGERFWTTGFSAFQFMPTDSGPQYRQRTTNGDAVVWSGWKQFILQGEDSTISGKRTFLADVLVRKNTPNIVLQNSSVTQPRLSGQPQKEWS